MMNYIAEGQMTMFDPGSWFGKMSQGPSQAMTAMTSESSLKKPRASKKPDFLFLDLRGGRWSNAGCIMGDGFSIAWRLHDAQYWGVPQRRKRIALVADFGGNAAAEILFERESMSRDSEQSATEGERVTGNTSECFIGTDKEVTIGADIYNQALTGTMAHTLRSSRGDNEHVPCAVSFQERAGKPGGGKGILYQGEQCGALTTVNKQAVVTQQSFGQYEECGVASSLKQRDYKDATDLVLSYGIDRAAYNQGKNAQYNFSIEEEKIATQTAKGPGAVFCARDYKGIGGQDENKLIVEREVAGTLCARDYKGAVRRLTPLECERLQGFPDEWTNIGDWIDSKGKLHKGESDSPRYKALGNSIALPFWQWLAHRIAAHLPQGATMASLFDGIGGFPLVFSRAGVRPVWASEIEEFPIAVTKKHFAE